MYVCRKSESLLSFNEYYKDSCIPGISETFKRLLFHFKVTLLKI